VGTWGTLDIVEKNLFLEFLGYEAQIIEEQK
jgi:hypothetical protein